MKKYSAFFVACFLLLISLEATAGKENSVSKKEVKMAKWVIDPAHSSVGFRVRHLSISWVPGTFQGVEGEILVDEQDLTNIKVKSSIDVSTIDTRVKKRDDDLRSASFFDVEKYPKMTFESTKLVRKPDGKFQLFGNLTLHGVTKEVVLNVDGPTDEVKNSAGNPVRGVSASAKLNRKDFGLMWGKFVEGISMVGDDVEITIDLELHRVDN